MKRRYMPQGLLALDPGAFFFMFDVPDPPTVDTRQDVAIVTVRGPLEHHAKWWGDSYEGVVDRVAEALASAPKAVMLVIDSPGGLVSGCFDTARTLRALASEAGIPLYAFVDGQACSAAYALACSAERLYASETALVGSIGVIEALVDARAQNAKWGIDVTLITSGDRKADGNPSAEVTADVRSASQTRVDDLADAFFALVEEMRGIDATAVKALEAQVVVGSEAKRLGLVDELATFDQALAIASGTKERDMPQASKDMDDAIAKLRKAADGDDEDEAKKAKKMLAAMDEDDDKKDDAKSEDDDDEKPDAKSKGKAEDDDDEKPDAKAEDDDEKDEDAKASSTLKLAARIQQLEAAAAARDAADKKKAEDDERARLLATRPDFAPQALEVLQVAPLAVVKNAVEKWPRGKVRLEHNPYAAAANATATRGATQGDGDEVSEPDGYDIDVELGLKPAHKAIRNEGTRLYLGVMTPAQARAYEASKKQPEASGA